MNDDEAGPIETDTAEPAPEAKRQGRPPGYPKSGGRGRAKGALGRLPAEFRRYIDARGRPLEILSAISRGAKVVAAHPDDPSRKTTVYPTVAERAAAARTLLDRILPALRATEISGGTGLTVIISPADAGLLGGAEATNEAAWLATNPAFLLDLKAKPGGPGTPGSAAAEPWDENLDGLWIPPAPAPPPAVGTRIELEDGNAVVVAENLPDGRTRFEGRGPSGRLLGSSFNADSLSARIKGNRG